jgi:electron transport complex protein RnfB
MNIHFLIDLMMPFFPIFILAGFAALCGALLGYASLHFTVESDPMVEKINQKLPQTQCAQCGYPGCMPYAQAIASGDAEINQCPPGGENTIKELAHLLEKKIRPLNADYGEISPPKVAWIIEETCIGCMKCIHACPVDAIVGASQQMHTVIQSECTGCELCLPPCPMDCIEMPLIPITQKNWVYPKP